MKNKKYSNGKAYFAISDAELAERIEILDELKNTIGQKIKCELLIVTPAMAEEWLKKNDMNRNPNSSNRGFNYGKVMAEGNWDFNGQAIIFSDTDKLLDGGGRCTGIVASNSPILSIVITGVPENAFKTMDAIKTRTAKDVLEASHLMDDEKSTVLGNVASMGKIMLEWIAGRYGSHGSNQTRGTACSLEVQNFITEHLSEMRDCAKAAGNMHGAHREQLMPSARYFAAYMGYLVIDKGWSLTDVLPFFEELTNCSSTIRGEGHPIATLRSYLSRARLGYIKITDEQRFHMFARAWNCFMKGKDIKRFSLKSCNDVPISKSEFAAANAEKLECVASMAL